MKNIKFKVIDTEIKISEIGKLKAFNDNKKVYSFLIECNKDKESIHFIFYNSIHFTEERDIKKSKFQYASGMNEEQIKDLIYSVLSCIEMDYNAEDTDLKEFLDNYGYEYNRENENLFYKVKEQKQKLNKVFNEEQIKLFDENDDILKNFVDALVYQKDTKDLI